jgi:hypothetical protein
MEMYLGKADKGIKKATKYLYGNLSDTNAKHLETGAACS